MKDYAQKLHVNFINRFFILVIAPFVLILSLILHQSNSISIKNDKTINEKISAQVMYSTLEELNFAEDLADALLENQMLITFFDKEYRNKLDLSYYSSTIYDYVKITSNLYSNLKTRIYVDNDTIPTGYSMFYHLSTIKDIEKVKEFYNSDEQDSIWINGDTILDSAYTGLSPRGNYCYLKKIKVGQRKLGLIFIMMPQHTLKRINPKLEGSGIENYDAIFFEDYFIYNFTDSPITEKQLDFILSKDENLIFDKTRVYSIHNFKEYPFDIIVATPASSNRALAKLMTVVFLTFTTITVLLFVRYSNKVINDINYCLRAMNESINNNFKDDLHVDREDEISYIADRINFLIDRIRKLIDINIKQELSAKNTQIMALQHQINPHFLYNTMETFSSCMEINGLYEESAAMAALCRILRYNINSTSILVTLEDEILQVENYIKIQRVRKIPVELIIDIPNDVLSTPIIRFVLQPFVENSFKYRKEGIPLIIEITAERQGKLVIITIKDNGKGIEPDKLKEINRDFQRDKKNIFSEGEKIGLSNINERLKLFYGSEHYIRAFVDNDHTIFKILIKDEIPPAIAEEDDWDSIFPDSL